MTVLQKNKTAEPSSEEEEVEEEDEEEEESMEEVGDNWKILVHFNYQC